MFPVPNSPPRRWGGLLVRRERWSLSATGRFLAAAILVGAAFAFLHGLYPFLRVAGGGTGDVLVVEGWISTRRIEAATRAYQQGRYQHVVVVRNIYHEGNKWESGRYTADYVAADLVDQGVPSNAVHVLLCPVVQKDRSYSCALAVREWLAQNQSQVRALDVATLGTHTRRSRLLYRKAFGHAVRVEAVPLDDPAYDPAHWWRTSEGVRDVPFEFLAYLYARFLFHPPVP